MFFAILLPVLSLVLYWYGTRTFNFWKKKGVKQDPPLPFLGNNASSYLMQKSIATIYSDIYKKYPNEKVVGFYRSLDPELVIRDPDLVKCVLQTDFSYFYNRGLFTTKADDIHAAPLEHHLFSASGDLWRLLRHRMTPAFTSAKLKAMFPLIVKYAEHLQTRLASLHEQNIDARDIMARFTTDFIGACGFGIDANSLNKEDSEFRRLGKKIMNISVKDSFKFLLKLSFPGLMKDFHPTNRFMNDLMSLLNSVLAARNHVPSGRNDFLDLMLECKSKGLMVGESLEHFKADGTPEKTSAELTDGLIAAQVFVFFVAGFETSSSSTSFTLHQLAYYPEVQKKLHEHIDRVLAEHDNKLSYDSVKAMHYLEWTFKESMRMFSPVGFLIRLCTKRYTFEDIGLTIDPGTKVVIPVHAMHNDPQYFESPEEFRPERFDPQNLNAERIKYTYLPFGEGPRNCIGEFKPVP